MQFVVGILRTIEYAVEVALVEDDVAVGNVDKHAFVGAAHMTLAKAIERL